MKPTQEQVIAWALDTGCWETDSGELVVDEMNLTRFATLAYEAGRKDENEACAVEVAAALAQQDHLAGKRKMVAQPEPEPVATLFGSLPVYDVPPAKPVAWVENLENARPHCVTDLKYCSVAQHERGEHLKYIPLYAAPPQQHSEQSWKHEVSNAWAEGYKKGRVFCGCGDQIMPDDGAECGNCVTARNA